MALLTDADWTNFKNIVNAAHDDFNQDTIIWKRHNNSTNRYGEDDNSDSNFTTIELKSLVQYNTFRLWPIQDETIAGLLDNESMAVFFNIHYLKGLGYADSDGYLKLDPAMDYFIHRGQKYRSAGETLASQAKDEPLHCIIILKRFNSETGDEKF